tara:strand:- start:1588 stop:1908 length:321 start_codon:yes stop_codon:yes gene_type:complete
VQVKTKKHFNEIVKSLVKEILKDEDLEEITATGNVAGYNTPNAFSDGSKKSKKKKKKYSTTSTGYSVVSEDIDNKDIKVIKKLIRDVVANILRDIWLKRNAWKQPK